MRILIILALLISSCTGTKTLIELSELTIENRPSNKLIVDRKPDYGIDGRDGCVAMREISMDITELDSRKSIYGKVFDSETKEPLINAKLIISIERNGVVKKIELNSNENGIYQTNYHGELKQVEVEYIGYRNLKIDFGK